mmetsp:Transcript_90557/g.255656  ORF Transcript_90557/g.255656 Transcript_90557/m.255656 type:complete len:264 (-) Transcript_90557:672-1463(-)
MVLRQRGHEFVLGDPRLRAGLRRKIEEHITHLLGRELAPRDLVRARHRRQQPPSVRSDLWERLRGEVLENQWQQALARNAPELCDAAIHLHRASFGRLLVPQDACPASHCAFADFHLRRCNQCDHGLDNVRPLQEEGQTVGVSRYVGPRVQRAQLFSGIAALQELGQGMRERGFSAGQHNAESLWRTEHHEPEESNDANPDRSVVHGVHQLPRQTLGDALPGQELLARLERAQGIHELHSVQLEQYVFRQKRPDHLLESATLF